MPIEEMIWSKAFLMERERFDGADVLHLVRARQKEINWPRLLSRFGEHWRVLLSHLVLFPYVYPNDPLRKTSSTSCSTAQERAESRRGDSSVPGTADLARAVSGRYRAVELRRCAPSAAGHDDARRDRHLDESHRQRNPTLEIAIESRAAAFSDRQHAVTWPNPRNRIRRICPGPKFVFRAMRCAGLSG